MNVFKQSLAAGFFYRPTLRLTLIRIVATLHASLEFLAFIGKTLRIIWEAAEAYHLSKLGKTQHHLWYLSVCKIDKVMRTCVIQFFGLQQGLISCNKILGKYMKLRMHEKAEWPEFKIFRRDIYRLLKGTIIFIFWFSSFSAINLQDFASS